MYKFDTKKIQDTGGRDGQRLTAATESEIVLNFLKIL